MEAHLKFETWPIDRLVEYARNPRKNDHAVDKIAAAIKEFGFRVPVVAKSDGLVVDGHLRLKAAKKLGLKEIPVILADDMTDAQIKAFRISVNRMAEFAEWDNELLALELGELGDAGFDLELTGFTDEEIKALMPVEVNEGLTDDDAVPEVPEQPVTVPGDVWILGKHRLMCGDSTDAGSVALLMDGEKADSVITDPPYNVGKDYAGEDLNQEQFDRLHRGWLSIAFDISKQDAAFYIYFGVKWLWPMSEIVNDYLCNPRLLVWYRPDGHGAGGGDFFYNYDPIFYGSKTGKFAVRKYEGEFNRDVWIVNKAKPGEGGYEHPTAKPIKVVEGAILTSTNEGDVILDSFGGSGTTLIAAEKNGRAARLMELDPRYCDVIIKRWQDYTGQQAIHADTGKPFAEVASGNEEAET